MPELHGTVWEEQCWYENDFKQLDDRRKEESAKSGEDSRCMYTARGSNCEQAMKALEYHVKGKHGKKVAYREDEGIKKRDKEEEERTEKKNKAELDQLRKKNDEQIRLTKLTKEAEGEAEVKKMNQLVNLKYDPDQMRNPENGAGEPLKVESVLMKEREFPQWGQKQEYESWFQD